MSVPSSVGDPPLSLREREVAALVARGLTNRQVAATLTLAEGTVANHVRRVLLRLGLRNRTQLAAWALERGFPPGPLPIAGGAAAPPDGAGDPAGALSGRVVFVVGHDRGARGVLTGALV